MQADGMRHRQLVWKPLVLGHDQPLDANVDIPNELSGWNQELVGTKQRIEYCQILNDNIQTATGTSINDHGDFDLGDSYIGVTHWASKEKAVFFYQLDRIGRDKVATIAAAIGTKSEVEVLQYLQLLDRGLRDYKLSSTISTSDTLASVPIANEISEQCCEALDEYFAGHLRDALKQDDEIRGRSKYGHFWRLSLEEISHMEDFLDDEQDEKQGSCASPESEPGDKPMEIENALGAADIDKQQTINDEATITNTEHVPKQAPPEDLMNALHLLDLRNWLYLSQNVFMNTSRNIEDNWRTLGVKDELPSLSATAVLDFHTLTVTLTERLVQVALFACMSRHRSNADNLALPDFIPEVGHPDVLAAIDLLGIAPTPPRRWIDSVRRYGLRVHDYPQSILQTPARLSEPMSNAQVEHQLELILEGRSLTEQPPRAVSSNAQDTMQHQQPQGGGPTPVDNATSESNDPLDQVDQHLDARDLDASWVEERRLWALLGFPKPIQRSNAASSADRNLQISNTALETDDSAHIKTIENWRQHTKYEEEWERNGALILCLPDRRLIVNKRKRVAVDNVYVATRQRKRRARVEDAEAEEVATIKSGLSTSGERRGGQSGHEVEVEVEQPGERAGASASSETAEVEMKSRLSERAGTMVELDEGGEEEHSSPSEESGPL